MPKSQYVDPGKAFDAGYIHFEEYITKFFQPINLLHVKS